MTTTPPDSPPQDPAPGDSGPRAGWDEIRDLGRIRRVIGDRRLGGVAGGLGRHLDIDPVIVRVAFVVLTFFGGVGLLLYVALWVLLPEEGSDWGRLALDRRSRTVALLLVGVLAVVILFSNGWWASGVPWVLLLCLAVVGVVVSQVPSFRARRRNAPDQPGDQPGDQPRGGASYATRTSADPGYAPPTSTTTYQYVEQPRPVNPRKRGPILLWFSLALMAVALGVLGIVDLAGADVAPSAYPALALAVSGVMLLVGAFFGRAGGLILVGLIAAAATVGSTVADRWEPHRDIVRPVAASAVQSSYRIDVGDLVVDLTQVSDPESLDGRTVQVVGGVGHLDIRVPRGVTVLTHAAISGPGGVNAFGQDTGGINTEVDNVHDGGPGSPTLTVDVQLHIGAIDLSTRTR